MSRVNPAYIVTLLDGNNVTTVNTTTAELALATGNLARSTNKGVT